MERYSILLGDEFLKWYEPLKDKEKSIIEVRLTRIREDMYFGDSKYLGDSLSELHWKNGRRIYFTKIDQLKLIILLGGYKNAQKKDIKKARLLLRRYTSS